MKNLQFFQNFQENVAIFSNFFWNFLKVLAKIWRKKFRKFRNMHLAGVRGAEPPDASEFLEMWVEKSMETGDFWIVLMEFFPFFQIFKITLSNISQKLC